MKKLDAFEKEILDAYEKGELKSASPSKENLDKFRAAATATSFTKLAKQILKAVFILWLAWAVMLMIAGYLSMIAPK